VHVLTELPPEAMAEYDRPVGIGTLVTVDTNAPVDILAIAKGFLTAKAFRAQGTNFLRQQKSLRGNGRPEAPHVPRPRGGISGTTVPGAGGDSPNWRPTMAGVSPR